MELLLIVRVHRQVSRRTHEIDGLKEVLGKGRRAFTETKAGKALKDFGRSERSTCRLVGSTVRRIAIARFSPTTESWGRW